MTSTDDIPGHSADELAARPLDDDRPTAGMCTAHLTAPCGSCAHRRRSGYGRDCLPARPRRRRQPASRWPAADEQHAGRPAPEPRPVTITGFDDYTAVRNCDYPGPRHYGYVSLRFKGF